MSPAGRQWRPTYIGIGSNLNGPVEQVETAFGLLGELPKSRLVARSSLYRSAPFGGIEQPDFVNAVAALETQLDARSLLGQLQHIEQSRGREHGGERWGPRIIDLDLLVYDDVIIDEPDLTVPHPGIAERNFVLLPLREIAPGLEIPGLGCVDSIAVNEEEPRISHIE
ncbi:MAG: 2-amino-4-hydroxy-6-hydroxymethyldihydropteridine diphosphokinase [Woeseiaceae bacterium]